MEIKEFGTLRLDGQPRPFLTQHNSEKISLGDSIDGLSIPFLMWTDRLWVSTWTICLGVSWNSLNEVGFIYGKPLKIDNTPYLCRSLRVGQSHKVENEWDDILNRFGDDDSLWHWKNMCFWGQERAQSNPTQQAWRGFYSAHHWECQYGAHTGITYGFRPVLKKLPANPEVSDELIGSHLQIYGPNGNICGVLREYSDYDLVLGDILLYSPGQTWNRVDDNMAVVDREAIVWMKKE